MIFSNIDYYLKKILRVKTYKEEIIRNEIDRCLKEIGNKIPEKTLPAGSIIRPFFVSFKIPGTKNEAFLHIACKDGEEVTFRLDVVRKGSDRTFTHYLNSCPCSEIEFYILKRFNRNEIYDSVIYLSKKADKYFDEN